MVVEETLDDCVHAAHVRLLSMPLDVDVNSNVNMSLIHGTSKC
jgi:hypothetical protein